MNKRYLRAHNRYGQFYWEINDLVSNTSKIYAFIVKLVSEEKMRSQTTHLHTTIMKAIMFSNVSAYLTPVFRMKSCGTECKKSILCRTVLIALIQEATIFLNDLRFWALFPHINSSEDGMHWWSKRVIFFPNQWCSWSTVLPLLILLCHLYPFLSTFICKGSWTPEKNICFIFYQYSFNKMRSG